MTASQQTSSEVGRSLLERLRVTDAAQFLAIPPKALRKYIAYARKYFSSASSSSSSSCCCSDGAFFCLLQIREPQGCVRN
jgi:hypothetical protein